MQISPGLDILHKYILCYDNFFGQYYVSHGARCALVY
uniref:Uncharacterized protein n=1 Tax=Anguilla anguilla TaxID=7936 RepID=A0A0E9P8W4_ANGAN